MITLMKHKRVISLIILISLMAAIYIVLRLYITKQIKWYKSEDFTCKTNQECRIWARVNNKTPNIACIGGYICNENREKCGFSCGGAIGSGFERVIIQIISQFE